MLNDLEFRPGKLRSTCPQRHVLAFDPLSRNHLPDCKREQIAHSKLPDWNSDVDFNRNSRNRRVRLSGARSDARSRRDLQHSVGWNTRRCGSGYIWMLQCICSGTSLLDLPLCRHSRQSAAELGPERVGHPWKILMKTVLPSVSRPPIECSLRCYTRNNECPRGL